MKITKLSKVKGKLESLKVNESFNFEEFISEHWGDFDFFTTRSFDVYYSNSKKMLPEKKFKRSQKLITRIK